MHPRQLLQALSAGTELSGAQLADQLGLSRAAIWKQVEQLRAHGLPIEARRGAGYRLPWPVQALDVECIREHLHVSPGVLEVHWSLDSTSSECQRRAQTLPDASVVLSEMQQAGRGRRGKSWISPPGLNLYVSCLKRFQRGFSALSGLSLAVGVALVRALETLGVEGVGLKWPNDVLVADRGAKLAGMLVELSGEYQGPSTAIIGVGLNLRLPQALRDRVGQDVADMVELQPTAVADRNRVAACVIDHLLEALHVFDAQGFQAFAADYARHDLLYDRKLRFSGVDGSFEAVGAGVDERGALKIVRDGKLDTIDSAEVSVRTQ